MLHLNGGHDSMESVLHIQSYSEPTFSGLQVQVIEFSGILWSAC